MYKYQNSQAAEYNGLRVEVQIRTKKNQHIWATAVETMGTFLGQALKSRQGDKKWLEFFAIISSAFACIEGTPVLPKHKNMNEQEIVMSVANAEATLGALNRMRGFSTAVDANTKKGKKEGWSYHLIVLDSLERTVRLRAYSRDEFQKALQDYSRIEEAGVKGEKIELVLVSAGRVSTLRRAYPNFFLDISESCKAVEQIIRKTKNNGLLERLVYCQGVFAVFGAVRFTICAGSGPESRVEPSIIACRYT